MPRVDIVYAYQDSDGVAVRAFVEAGLRVSFWPVGSAGGGLGGEAMREASGLSWEALQKARDMGVMVVAVSRNSV